MAARDASAPTALWPGAPDAAPTPWWAPLASAVLPGSGQALLRQDRAVMYLAVEGYSWARYVADVREARRERAAYRALANDVARAFFSETKPTGDFEYYERLEHYVESGVYDLVPGGALEPETDTTTFNGSLWLRARTTYFSHPDSIPARDSEPFRLALALYDEQAVRPEFRWSWRNAQLEQDLFRRTIASSNDAFRRSIVDLGVVLGNHVLSTVDAFVSLRLRYRRAEPRELGLAATIPWAPFGRPHPSPPRPPRR